MSDQNQPAPQGSREPLSKTVIAAIVAISGLLVAITGLVAVWPSSTTASETSVEAEPAPVSSSIVATTTAARPTSDTTTSGADSTTTTQSAEASTTTMSLGAVAATSPLRWVVEADPSFFSESAAQSFGYVMPATLGQIGKAPSDDCRTWYAWTSDLDMERAVSEGPMFQVVVSSSVDDSIVINGISVEVNRRDSPMDGTEVLCSGLPLTDPLRVHTLNIDLDRDPPVVTLERPTSDEAETDDIAFQFTGKGDTLLLEVWAMTVDCDCDWVLVLSYVNVGTGERGRIEITDGDEPWRSTARRNADSYEWMVIERDWKSASLDGG